MLLGGFIQTSRASPDRRRVQISGAATSLFKSQSRLLRAESVAEKQLLRLRLCKSKHLFGNHKQTLLGTQTPQRRRQQTSSQNQHVYFSRQQRKQAMEERNHPIGVVDQMQVVKDQKQWLRLSLQIIDKRFRQCGEVECG